MNDTVVDIIDYYAVDPGLIPDYSNFFLFFCFVFSICFFFVFCFVFSICFFFLSMVEGLIILFH